MKKFLLMFAAVAAIAFVGCKTETETKPAEETPVEEATAEYTVESVQDQLLNAADENAAMGLLDNIKAKAEEYLKANDNNKYFELINIVKTVWDNCKDQLSAKFPGLVEKINDYITVPDNLKEGFNAFVDNAAKQAADAAAQKVEDVKDAAGDAAQDVKDAATEKVEDVKDAAADAAQGVANELKK